MTITITDEDLEQFVQVHNEHMDEADFAASLNRKDAQMHHLGEAQGLAYALTLLGLRATWDEADFAYMTGIRPANR